MKKKKFIEKIVMAYPCFRLRCKACGAERKVLCDYFVIPEYIQAICPRCHTMASYHINKMTFQIECMV